MTTRRGKDLADAGHVWAGVRVRQRAQIALLTDRVGRTERDVLALALALGLRVWCQGAGISHATVNRRDTTLREDAPAGEDRKPIMSKPALVRDELIRLEGGEKYYLRRVCVLLSPDGTPTGARWPLLLAGPFPRHQLYDAVSGALRVDAAALLATETSGQRLWLHGSVGKHTQIVATF